MKTINGIEYSVENGKYTIDGYDYFDTLGELEADIEWQLDWINGEAYKGEDGWVSLVEEPGETVEDLFKAVAEVTCEIYVFDSFTEKFLGMADGYKAFRKWMPGAEILDVEVNEDGSVSVWC